MQIVKSISQQKESIFWTHDAIIHKDIIGRVNEPLVITTEEGKKCVPATIVYIKDRKGDRRYKASNYRRDLIDYVRDISKLDNLGLGEYKIYDPISEVFMVAIPVEESEIIKSDQSLNEIILNNGKLSEPLLRLTKLFENIQFGVIGSVQLGLDGEESDVDLVIYGGKEYFEVINCLMDPKLQHKLGIEFQDNERIDKNATKYQERYSILFDEAKEISKLRARFLLKLNNGDSIKLGINSCFKRGQHDGVTILGTTKLKTVEITGKIVDATNCCSFPREYILDNEHGKFLLASHHWGHQLLAPQGVRINVKCNLRKTESGRTIYFLEDDRVCFVINDH